MLYDFNTEKQNRYGTGRSPVQLEAIARYNRVSRAVWHYDGRILTTIESRKALLGMLDDDRPVVPVDVCDLRLRA